MLEIRLLGGIELALTDGSTLGRLGAKAQGVLVLLAMSRGAAVSRARLAGLLWCEHGEEAARHSLSQALTTIRAALGPAAAGILQAGPDGLRLARDGFELDVDVFESMARSHQHATLEEACRFYRGEFLDGLEIREAGFEEWMLTERYRLRELAADALARLLDLQTTAGDTDAAVETARRLVALSPLDEKAHARLIQLYGAQRRKGLAEAQYTRCSELLQRELGQAPGEELRAALAHTRRQLPSESVPATPGPARPVPDRRQAQPQHAKHWMRAWWPATAAASLLLVGTLTWTYHGESTDEVGETSSYQSHPWELSTKPSIAVLPFENLSGGQEQAYWADGITNDIITDLSKFSTLFVIAANSSFHYRGQAVQAQDVARDLGVRYLLEGSLQQAGNMLRINANLIDATTGRQVWAERYERPTENVLVVQREVAQNIVGVIGSDGGALERAEFERIARVPTKNLRAYDLYLRGARYNYRKTKEDNARARQMFEEAIEADNLYARAIADLSMTYVYDIFNNWADDNQEWQRRAEELSRRAIEIGPSEPWGFVALGLVYQLRLENDYALPLFEKAHALNPNDYYVKEALGYAVTYAGSADRGVELLEMAQRLNPYHAEEHPRTLGMAYFFARRYEDALMTVNRITHQGGSPYWLYKAAAHAELGRLDEARTAVAEALKLDPDLTVEGEHERRLALGLAPAYAEQLTAALLKAGLPTRAAPY